MEYKLEIPLNEDDKEISLSLQEIVNNCECEEKSLEDFVSNKHKTRVQCNMLEAKEIIRKLNSRK